MPGLGLGLGTDGYDDKQCDCEKSKAAHGMTPVMDDTEAVPWKFLKTSIKEKAFNAPKFHGVRQK